MIFTADIVIQVHKRIIATSGGAKGIKYMTVLESAVNSIYQTYDSKGLYPTLIEKAARLCFSLNKNHPFVDGNKRVSMHMLGSFLRFHDIDYAPANAKSHPRRIIAGGWFDELSRLIGLVKTNHMI